MTHDYLKEVKCVDRLVDKSGGEIRGGIVFLSELNLWLEVEREDAARLIG